MTFRFILIGVVSVVVLVASGVYLFILEGDEAKRGTLDRLGDGEVLVDPSLRGTSLEPKTSKDLARIFNIKPPGGDLDSSTTAPGGGGGSSGFDGDNGSSGFDGGNGGGGNGSSGFDGGNGSSGFDGGNGSNLNGAGRNNSLYTGSSVNAAFIKFITRRTNNPRGGNEDPSGSEKDGGGDPSGSEKDGGGDPSGSEKDGGGDPSGSEEGGGEDPSGSEKDGGGDPSGSEEGGGSSLKPIFLSFTSPSENLINKITINNINSADPKTPITIKASRGNRVLKKERQKDNDYIDLLLGNGKWSLSFTYKDSLGKEITTNVPDLLEIKTPNKTLGFESPSGEIDNRIEVSGFPNIEITIVALNQDTGEVVEKTRKGDGSVRLKLTDGDWGISAVYQGLNEEEVVAPEFLKVQTNSDEDFEDFGETLLEGEGGGGGGGSGSSLLSGVVAAAATLLACLAAGLGGLASIISVPTNDLANVGKECLLDGIARIASSALTQGLLSKYVNWSNEANFFQDNPSEYWKNLADEAVGSFLTGEGLGFFCNDSLNLDFTRLIKDELGIGIIKTRACKGSDIFDNINKSTVDFGVDVDIDVNVKIIEEDVTFRPFNVAQSFSELYIGTFFDAQEIRNNISGDTVSKREQVTSETGALMSSHDADKADGCGSDGSYNSDGLIDIDAFINCLTQPTIYQDYSLISESFSFASQLPLEQVSEADEFSEIGSLLSSVIEQTFSNVFQNLLEGGIDAVDTGQLDRNANALANGGDSVFVAFIDESGYAEAEEYVEAAGDARYLLSGVIGNEGNYLVTNPKLDQDYKAYEIYKDHVKKSLESKQVLGEIPSGFKAKVQIKETLERRNKIVIISRKTKKIDVTETTIVDEKKNVSDTFLYYEDVNNLSFRNFHNDLSYLEQKEIVAEKLVGDYKSTLGVYLRVRGEDDVFLSDGYKNERNEGVKKIRSKLVGSDEVTPQNVEKALVKKIKNGAAPAYKKCTDKINVTVEGQGFCESGTLNTLKKEVRETKTKNIARALSRVIYLFYENGIIDIPNITLQNTPTFNLQSQSYGTYGTGYDQAKTVNFARIFSKDDDAIQTFRATKFSSNTIGRQYNAALRGRVQQKILGDYSNFWKSVPGGDRSSRTKDRSLKTDYGIRDESIRKITTPPSGLDDFVNIPDVNVPRPFF